MNKNIVGSQVSQEELEEKLTNVIMRQTEYDKDLCIVKLREHNYNVKKIILFVQFLSSTLLIFLKKK